MKKSERLQIYKNICMHPKFLSIPERYQEAFSYMADGFTDQEIWEMYKISHGTPWFYREATFKRLHFTVFDKGHTRAMTMEEIKSKYPSLASQKQPFKT